MKNPTMVARLVVESADEAIAFYERVFGARCIERTAMPDGRLVDSKVDFGEVRVAVIDTFPGHNMAPPTFGGSPVIFSIDVDDPDATAAAVAEAGGEILIEIDDRAYGYREGRVRDPFGHLWIVSKRTEDLSHDEILRRLHAES